MVQEMARDHEFAAAMEQHMQFRKEMFDKLLAVAKAEFPDVDYDKALTRLGDLELNIFPDNLTYIHVSSYPRYASKRKTDLGLRVEWAERDNKPYMMRITDYTVCFIEPYSYTTSEVQVSHFFKDTGARMRYRRRHIKVHENSKGRFIILNRERIYLPAEWARYSSEG